MQTGHIILKQSKQILENKQYAIACAALFSIIPFCAWLSVALIALVTLRKGAKTGFEIMLPAMIIHSVPLMMLMPLNAALVNALITYLPCYAAALSLRKTTSWQVVAVVFLLQASLAFLLIQLLYPEFINSQLIQFKKLLADYQDYQQWIDKGIEGMNTSALAQLFFGIQILSVVVAALVSLVFARSIQAKLFMPGGFKAEFLGFRSGKLSFLLLLTVAVATFYEIPLAINTLPLVLCYFLLSGFSLIYYALTRKWQTKMILLLFLFVLAKPIIVLFAFVVFGSLDSLFNFRLYLPERVRESV